MKHFIATAILVTTATVWTACGNSENKRAETQPHDSPATTQQTAKPAAETAPGLQLKDDNLNAIYQHYAHLTNALVDSDAAEAKVAANAIEAGAAQMQGGNMLAAAAAKIVTANDIEVQRKAYEELTAELRTKIKATGMASGALYVQHCPMAFNDRGASWISSVQEVRNPYFGDKMLNCGTVEETIP